MRSLSRLRRLQLEPLESRAVPAVLLTPSQTAGVQADGDTIEVVDVSDSGRYMLFTSKANNIVTGVSDSNGVTDLFWVDTQTNQRQIVSARPGLVAVGFDDSVAGRAVLSGDGLFVAFVSATRADVLTGVNIADQNATDDVFRWTAATRLVELVSARNTGNGNVEAVGNGSRADQPNISTNGSKIAYLSKLDNNFITNQALFDTANTNDVYLRNFAVNNVAGAGTTPVTVDSANPTFMVGNNGDTFVTEGGRYLSADGNRIVFSTGVEANFIVPGTVDQSTATNTIDVFVRDLSLPIASSVRLVSFANNTPLAAIGNVAGQEAGGAVISADGSTIAFLSNAPGDATGSVDATQLVSNYKSNGTGVSLYTATNLFNPLPLVSLVNGKNGSFNEAGTNSDISTNDYDLSTNGAVILFNSVSPDLVSSAIDTNGAIQDAFVRDFTTATPTTELVSQGDFGVSGVAASTGTSISGDGSLVVFQTTSSGLLVGVIDNNGVNDVFVRDRFAQRTRIASANPAGRIAGNGQSSDGQISTDGTTIGFISRANNLTSGLTGTTSNLYGASLPLPSPLSLSGFTIVSGQQNGSTQGYLFNASFALDKTGISAFSPFPGFNGDVRTSTADIDGDSVPDAVYGVGPGGGSTIRVVTSSGIDVTFNVFEDGFSGGVFVAVGDIDGDGFAEIVVSPDVGGGGRTVVFQLGANNQFTRVADFFGIQDPNFRGGARVTLGDVNGDGFLDVIVAAGFGGGPRVAIFDGVSVLTGTPIPQKLVNDFFTFSPADALTLTNGAYVTAGDLDADGKADLIFGGGPGGGPRIFALSGAGILSNVELEKQNPLANFFAGDFNLRGGVRVAAKDIDGDPFADLVVGSGESTPPTVRTYLGRNFPSSGQGEPTLQQTLVPFDGVPIAGVFVG